MTQRDKDLVDFCIKRQGTMKVAHDLQMSVWQQIGELVLPRRAEFFNQNDATTGRSSGRIVNTEKLHDGTAVWCNEQLAATLHGSLTSPTQRWFGVETEDESLMKVKENKDWLLDSTDRMYAVFNSTKTYFTSQVHESYLDLGAFGNLCMYTEEDWECVVRFVAHHLADIFIMENNKKIVDVVHRTFPFTVRQAVQQWKEQAPKKLIEYYNAKKDLDKSFDFLHCVFPREDRDYKRIDNKNKPFASLYIWDNEKELVSESGYDELPYLFGRWSKTTSDQFGKGPGNISLPDNKMLQQMWKTILKAAQKQVDPPLLVPDDGFLLPIRTSPSSLIYYTADGTNRELIKPLETKGKINLGFDLIEKKEQQIMKAFYIDWLQLREGPQMTATEVLQRTEERMRLMSPMIGRLQSEFLGPMIERVFNIMMRQHRFRPAPRMLQGRNLKIKYVSPVVKAQKMTQAIMVERFFQSIAPFAQTRPDMLDKLSGDGIVDWFAELYDAPDKILNSEDQTKQVRDARSQKINEETQKSDMERMAAGSRNIAPLLKVVQNGGMGGIGGIGA